MTATSHPTTTSDRERAVEADGHDLPRPPTIDAPGPDRRSSTIVVLFALSAGAAALAWDRMFIDASGVWICVLAVVAAVAIAGVSNRLRVPFVVAPALSLAGLVLLGSVAAVPVSGLGPPTVPALGTTLGWLPTMWNATLDLGIPTASRGQPLLLAISITWVLAAVGTELVIRSRARAAALACPVLLFSAALLLGSPLATSPLLLTLPVILTSMLFLMVSGARQDPDGAEPGSRTPATSALPTARGFALKGGLGLIAAGGLALALAGLFPWDNGEPPSLHRTPEFEPTDFTSPLSTVTAQMVADPPERLFELDGLTDEAVARIAIAHLENYNGDTWESRANYRPISGFAGDEALPADSSTAVSGTVEILDLSGPWLPAFGHVTRIDLPEVQSDGASANFVVTSELPSGTTYSFESQVITDSDAVAAATGRTPPQPEHLLLPEDVTVDPGLEADVDNTCRTSDVVTVAEEWTDGVESAGGSGRQALAKARTIENRLRDGYSLREENPVAGHTLADLCRVLGIRTAGQPQPANSEQFAATMALMLRGIGIPSRVVVGYELRSSGDGVPVVVTEHDVTAWVEASIGAGWVAFDPTPGENREEDSENRAVTERQPAPPPTNPPVVDEPPATTTTTTSLPPSPDTGGGGPAGGAGAAAGAGGLLLVVVALTLISVLKSLRRSRRRKSLRPGDAVLGAWLEALDLLRDRGFTPAPERTSGELASDATSFTHRPTLRARLTHLAALADRAMYSKVELPGDQPEHAWNEFESFESELNADSSKLQRFRSRLTLRSFRRSPW